MITSTSALTELQSLSTAKGPAATRRVAQEFEAMIVGEMLRSASKPMMGSHPLDGGSAGRMAREQFLSELSQIVSRGHGIGLARQLESQMQSETDTAEVDEAMK